MCCRCKRLMSAARILQCEHTFDLDCLNFPPNAQEVYCPVCFRVTPLDQASGGVYALPVPWMTLENILTRSSLGKYVLHCTGRGNALPKELAVCKDLAVALCVDCGFLCEAKLMKHRANKLEGHRFIAFEEFARTQQLRALSKLQPPNCKHSPAVIIRQAQPGASVSLGKEKLAQQQPARSSVLVLQRSEPARNTAPRPNEFQPSCMVHPSQVLTNFCLNCRVRF